MSNRIAEDHAKYERRMALLAPPEQAPCFVAVMLEDRAFGGNEEGGWWYNTSERIETHYAANNDVLAKIMARLEREYSNEGRRPISSVLSEGLYRIKLCRNVPPKYEPAYRPHYE